MRLKKKAEQRLQKKESKSSQFLIQKSLSVLWHEIYSGETVQKSVRQDH